MCDTFKGCVMLQKFTPVVDLTEVSGGPTSCRESTGGRRGVSVMGCLTSLGSCFPRVALTYHIGSCSKLLEDVNSGGSINGDDGRFIGKLHVLDRELPVNQSETERTCVRVVGPASRSGLLEISNGRELRPFSGTIASVS